MRSGPLENIATPRTERGISRQPSKENADRRKRRRKGERSSFGLLENTATPKAKGADQGDQARRTQIGESVEVEI